MPSFKIDLDADFQINNQALAKVIKDALSVISLPNTTFFLVDDAVRVTELVDEKPFIEADHAAELDTRAFGCFACVDDSDDPAPALDVEETSRHWVPFRARI